MPSKYPFSRVSLLGCGWLFTPLAQYLQNKKLKIKVSVTQKEKQESLKKQGLDCFLLSCKQSLIGDYELFFDTDCLLIGLPFKRSFSDPFIYLDQIKMIYQKLEASSVSYVLFTSSTGIYDGCEGQVTENTNLCIKKPRVDALNQVEQYILTHPRIKSCVVRLAGLYGPNRDIAAFWAGKTCAKPAYDPVNLIHQQDCIEILSGLLQCQFRGVYNVVSDAHPTRKELYETHAKIKGFSSPVFTNLTKTSNPRKVSNNKLKKTLQYQFIHPNPLCVR